MIGCAICSGQKTLHVVTFPHWVIHDDTRRPWMARFVHCFADDEAEAVSIAIGRLLKLYGLPTPTLRYFDSPVIEAV